MAKKRSKSRRRSGSRAQAARTSQATQEDAAGGRAASSQAQRSRPTSSRTVRKEEARRQREAIRRRTERRRRLRAVATRLVVPLAALGVIAFLLLRHTGSPSTPAEFAKGPAIDPNKLAGIEKGPPPWPAETLNLRSRLNSIGFPVLSAEAFTVHIHEHLDVYVNGNQVIVPVNIGINTAEGFLSPLHTHDDTGVIHVESPTKRTYTVGEFFDVWGVRLTPDCLGGECAGGGKQLRVYVDGQLASGDPRLIKIIAHQEVAVTFGTQAQLPDPVPSSYSFPAGL